MAVKWMLPQKEDQKQKKSNTFQSAKLSVKTPEGNWSSLGDATNLKFDLNLPLVCLHCGNNATALWKGTHVCGYCLESLNKQQQLKENPPNEPKYIKAFVTNTNLKSHSLH